MHGQTKLVRLIMSTSLDIIESVVKENTIYFKAKNTQTKDNNCDEELF